MSAERNENKHHNGSQNGPNFECFTRQDWENWIMACSKNEQFAVAVTFCHMVHILKGVPVQHALERVERVLETEHSQQKKDIAIATYHQIGMGFSDEQNEALFMLAVATRDIREAPKPRFGPCQARLEAIANSILPEFPPEEAQKLVKFSRELIRK